MLPCICSVIDHRGRLNVIRTAVTLLCSYRILTSSVIYYWTDARQHGIYFLIFHAVLTYLDVVSVEYFTERVVFLLKKQANAFGYFIR